MDRGPGRDAMGQGEAEVAVVMVAWFGRESWLG